MDETERQIKCDLLRTMPNNERFKSLDSEGVSGSNIRVCVFVVLLFACLFVFDY